MTKLFELRPISETDGLPDGWYRTVFDAALTYSESVEFKDRSWRQHTPLPFYLRPLHDAIAVGREDAGLIFMKGELYGRQSAKSVMFDTDVTAPDQQTYIDNLFNKK